MKLTNITLTATMFAVNLFAWQIDKRVVVDEKLDKLNLQKTTLNLTVGIGSGAYHYKNDPKNIIYTITDRGVNIKCKDSKKVMGNKICEKGKIFPVPNFAPTIYKIAVFNNWYKVLEKIQIKDKDGIPITGISNKGTENAYDIYGDKIEFDPQGLDTEALVRLSDGSFWVAEEYGSSILHIDSDGKILKRVVPEGFEKNIDGARYTISSSLPKIVGKRKLNRGIESIGISDDERYLYFSMQSPLANPNKKAYKKSRNVRMFKYDITQDKVIGEYVYRLDTADSFALDKNKKQSSVKVSELVVSGDDELILLERLTKSTKFYKVKLSDDKNILNSKWDDIKTSPSLEESKDFDNYLTKKLVLDTSNLKNPPKKIEGIAYIDENNWYLVNDNDFGIKKDKTIIIKVSR